MRRIKWTILIIPVFLLSLSCGKSEQSLQLTTGETTINPDHPLLGKWDLNPDKVWETDLENENLIASVQNIRISDQGKVVVLDHKNYKIHLFDDKGRIQVSFGTRGEGPGELKRLGSKDQLFLEGEHIKIADQGKIHYYWITGKFIKDIPYPGYLRPRALLGTKWLIGGPYVADNREQKLILYDFQTKNKHLILNYDTFQVADNTPKKSRPIVADGITPMMQVAAGNQRIYYGINSRYEIYVLNLANHTVRSFGIQGRTKEKVSESFINWLKSLWKDYPAERVKYYLDALPDYTCYFDRIFVDRRGFVYVFMVNLDEDHQRVCDIFGPGGKYLYRSEIRMDPGYKIKRFCLRDRHLALAVLDQPGNYRIYKYTITLPEPATQQNR